MPHIRIGVIPSLCFSIHCRSISHLAFNSIFATNPCAAFLVHSHIQLPNNPSYCIFRPPSCILYAIECSASLGTFSFRDLCKIYVRTAHLLFFLFFLPVRFVSAETLCAFCCARIVRCKCRVYFSQARIVEYIYM